MVESDRAKAQRFARQLLAHRLLNRRRPHTWRALNALQVHLTSRYIGSSSLYEPPTHAPRLLRRAGFGFPSSPLTRSDAKSQVAFGINVAQRGLWREAIYRWEKAVELDPSYAAAFNDLAIAYEHEGQLDKARKAYEKAIELDPNNTEIKQNFELFKEINDRTGAAKDKN